MAKVVFPTPPLPDETGMIRLMATDGRTPYNGTVESDNC
jgi:hypothetical protein